MNYDKENKCTECYYPTKYYLDNNGICSSKQMNCKFYSMQDGSCTDCYENYRLNDGACTPTLFWNILIININIYLLYFIS